jgi:endoglucanase
MLRPIIGLWITAGLLAACSANTPTEPPKTATPPLEQGQPVTANTSTPTIRPTAVADAYAYAQNQRLGRGVNLGNALEAPTEGEWGMVLEAEFFALIHEAGFDSVRVPIRWNAHAEADAPYTIAPDFFARVDWVLEQAQANELAAVINIHHYEEIMENPIWHKERFLAIWRQMAERYQDQPESVYFELLNEPYSTLANTSWNEFAAEAIAVIRQRNPNRTIIVGPGNWNAIDMLPILFLPEEDRNLIVTVHYYLPFQFTHQGAEWVENSDPWLGTTWDGTEAQKMLLERDLDRALKWSQQNARPIFLGEFGAYSKADMDSRARWTAFVARAAEARGFSWAYWEFGAGFGVFDRTAGEWVEPIRNALLP